MNKMQITGMGACAVASLLVWLALALTWPHDEGGAALGKVAVFLPCQCLIPAMAFVLFALKGSAPIRTAWQLLIVWALLTIYSFTASPSGWEVETTVYHLTEPLMVGFKTIIIVTLFHFAWDLYKRFCCRGEQNDESV